MVGTDAGLRALPDHKYDPMPEEFYQLAAFFNTARNRFEAFAG
jgi:hypothetical protein